MLNWGLISHPINWVTVTLMVFIGVIVLNLVLTPWHVTKPDSTGLNANSIPGPYLATSQ